MIAEYLSVCIFQSQLHWENVDANIHHFELLINEVKEHVDVMVLPEMFSTGFSMNTNNAETMDGKSVSWLQRIAKEKNIAICGSVMMQENNQFFNRFIWMNPEGTMQTYDKRHCFRMANEHEHFTPGSQKIIIQYKGFKICPLVCYDLRFPVWSRNKFTDQEFDYDVLLYVANWPERRSFAWQQLLPARAIENISFVIGVNRVGKDGYDVAYSGNTAVYNMLGEKISKTLAHIECHEIVRLSKIELYDFRAQFPAYLDADNFEIF